MGTPIINIIYVCLCWGKGVGGGGGGGTHLIHSWLTTGLFSDITGRDKAIDKVNIFVN